MPTMSKRRQRPTAIPTRNDRAFEVADFLSLVGHGRKFHEFKGKQQVFTQGDRAGSIFYLQQGRVQLTIVSSVGKEATLAILSARDFFGEGCLSGQPVRLVTATTLEDSIIMEIEKKAMLEVIHSQQAFADYFVAYLLQRNARYQDDLTDQLFNSSEKRLARALLLLARIGNETQDQVIPKVRQETLAEMIGTTRARVSHFMNKFRKMGFIDYNGHLRIHSSLLTVVLKD
jgi:CRP-like cAMP-binding protein